MVKRKQNSRATKNTLNNFVPVISVIVALYNAEKYIGEALDSLLAQTFKDFEIIVVDDCSTDSSLDIVKSYEDKFGDKLKILRMTENSGKPSLPRNFGLELSRGEYIYFMDNDDTLIETCLEQFYRFASEYDADVVYCENWYEINEDSSIVKKVHYHGEGPLAEPTMEPEGLEEHTKIFKNGIDYKPMPWLYLLRRDFLIENKIYFPNIMRDDCIWSWQVFLFSTKFLRVPDALYFWRNIETSITRKEKTPQQEINFWFNPILLGMKPLYDMLNKIEFFQQDHSSLYAVLSGLIKLNMHAALLKKSFQLQPFEIYDTIMKEFGSELGEHAVLVATLCAYMNTQQKFNAMIIQKYNTLEEKSQSRISELEEQLRNLRK